MEMNERVTGPGDRLTDSKVKEKLLVHEMVGIHLVKSRRNLSQDQGHLLLTSPSSPCASYRSC